jgi:hypothetical protein
MVPPSALSTVAARGGGQRWDVSMLRLVLSSIFVASLLSTACSDGPGANDDAGPDAEASQDASDAPGGEDTSSDTHSDADGGESQSDAPSEDAAPSDSGGPDTTGGDIEDGAAPDTVDIGPEDTSDATAPDSTDSSDGASDATDGVEGDAETDADGGGFDEHAAPSLETVAQFYELAGGTVEPSQVKFVLTRFFGPAPGETRYLESGFYALHDEWYWFRLLNGEEIPGWYVDPLEDSTFESIQEIYEAFPDASNLPLGLKYVGERLYSPEFYAAALAPNRFFGLGSLLYYPANPERPIPEELWLVELEYTDVVDEEILGIFFTRLAATLPPEIGTNLRWLARSPQQEQLGAELNAAPGPLQGRIVTYADLVVPGAFTVYNPGLAAGRVRIVKKGTLVQSQLSPIHLLVLEEIPDYLPPVAAIITGVPQTPLAHIAVLAKARGTPNAYVAGASALPQLQDWAYFMKNVAVWAKPSGVEWLALTSEEYALYKSITTKPPVELVVAPVDGMPVAIDLAPVTLESAPSLVPVVGGKAAHAGIFNDFPAIEHPEPQAALTVRGFVQHMQALEFFIRAVVEHPDFTNDGNLRFAALEGPAAYLEAATDAVAAQKQLDAWKLEYAPGSPLGIALSAGGVRGVIENTAIDAAYLAEITAFLKAHFSAFDESQGLRFRSSSTAEDVAAFNGAGLYESHTGFLYPAEQSGSDKKKTIAKAIAAVWSSTFSYEAFEERRLAGIDHFQARMGVLVHARFDDDKELANGVFTLTLTVRPEGATSELDLNMQKGALSVTNPPAGSTALPEVDRVVRKPSMPAELVRIQGSTEVAPGEWLLSDEELLAIAASAEEMALGWLAVDNAARPPHGQHSTLVLDFEMRRAAAGWPALQVGTAYPERLVWKQVRTLNRPPSLGGKALQLPVPGDVLAWSQTAWRRQCVGDYALLEWVELYTDPTQSWPFDFGAVPFLGRATLAFAGNAPLPSALLGKSVGFTHVDFAAWQWTGEVGASFATGSTTAEVAAASGIEAFGCEADGELWVTPTLGAPVSMGPCSCTTSPFVVSGSQYLQSLFEAQE